MRQQPSALEDIWLAQAKRLQALATTGLHFSQDPFDRERYEEMATIAREMLADLGQVPLSRIHDLVPDYAAGYATPSLDVRGAIIRGDEILLVKERADGKWAMPGGFADIGHSPAENTEKEVWEEAGLKVKASALYAVRHKAKHSYAADTRDFYKLFFICTELGDTPPVAGSEASEVAFFHKDDLPDLSLDRVIPEDIAAAFFFLETNATATRFD